MYPRTSIAMIEPQLPAVEEDRLEALCLLRLLDTPAEERFDRLTRIAATLFNVPIALVTLLDKERQWFKSRHGFAGTEAPRSISFCGHTINDTGPLIVPDALLDPRFHDNPLVLGEPHIRFYAGYPIFSPDGFALGTICIVDTKPRDAADINVECLRDLAKLVEEEIAKTAIAQNAISRREELNSALQHLSLHMGNSPLAVMRWDHSLRFNSWSPRAEEIFGWSAEEVLDKSLRDWQFVHADDRQSVDQVISRLITQKEPRNVTRSRHYHKDGRIVHCVWHNSSLYGEDGAPVAVLSLVQDVTAQVYAEDALRESEARFRATFEQAAVGIAHIGLDGVWLRVNQKLCEIVGYTSEELNKLTLADITHPNDRNTDLSFKRKILDGAIDTYSLEMRYLGKHGRIVWVNLTVSLNRSADGSPNYFIAVVEDIQSRKEAEHALQRLYEDLETRVEQRTQELKRSEERLRTITDSLPALISYIDKDERYQFGNATYQDWFGTAPSAMIGKSVQEVLGAKLYQLRSTYLQRAFAGETIRFEMDAQINGEAKTVETVFIPHLIDGAVAGIYTLSTDITSLKAIEKQLHSLARIDTLTDLPNRRSYDERLQDVVARCKRTGQSIALIFLDIDHFKRINDTLGHAGGDEVLKELANRLKVSVRATDTVSRLAGDEFTIILEGIRTQAEAAVVAQKILAAMQQPFFIQGNRLPVTVSIGIACSKPGDDDIQRLSITADKALYKAKADGRNRFYIFE